MSKRRGRDNRFCGDRSPNATPYMQKALAEFTAEPPNDSESIYEDQIRFGREQLAKEKA